MRAIWRPLPKMYATNLDPQLRVHFSRFGHHIIFFRELPSGKIGIMSMLHERMDLPFRLAEDLARLPKDSDE